MPFALSLRVHLEQKRITLAVTAGLRGETREGIERETGEGGVCSRGVGERETPASRKRKRWRV